MSVKNRHGETNFVIFQLKPIDMLPPKQNDERLEGFP